MTRTAEEPGPPGRRPTAMLRRALAVLVLIRVEVVERGSAGAQVALRTADQSTSCGYQFVTGHRYRVYVDEGSTSVCDGNADLGLADQPAEGPPAALWWSLASGAVLVAALILLRRRGKAQ